MLVILDYVLVFFFLLHLNRKELCFVFFVFSDYGEQLDLNLYANNNDFRDNVDHFSAYYKMFLIDSLG